MKNDDTCYVIGYIDAYGAIHHQPLTLESENKCHSHYWPLNSQKRWRFIISEWQLSNSVLSTDNLTPDEAENVIAFLRKHYTPPVWLIEGEEWEALGRPREGKAYKKHLRKWDRIHQIK